LKKKTSINYVKTATNTRDSRLYTDHRKEKSKTIFFRQIRQLIDWKSILYYIWEL